MWASPMCPALPTEVPGPCQVSVRAIPPFLRVTPPTCGRPWHSCKKRRHITNVLCTPEGNSVAKDASSGTFAKALSPYWLAQVAGWCAGQG